jgi:hypothetical protein
LESFLFRITSRRRKLLRWEAAGTRGALPGHFRKNAPSHRVLLIGLEQNYLGMPDVQDRQILVNNLLKLRKLQSFRQLSGHQAELLRQVILSGKVT